MKIIEKSLNLSDIGVVMSATLSRGDYNAYQFRFEVLQSGAEVSLDTFADIAVVFERADGKTGENRVSDGSVLVSADNRLIYNVPSSLCAVKGEVVFEIHFYHQDSRLAGLCKGVINIVSDISTDEDVVANPDFPILDALIASVDSLNNEAKADADRAEAAAAGIVTTEAQREASENLRVMAEQGRCAAESGRIGAEESREDAELSRTAAELSREGAEALRQAAEAIRASAETERSSAETARKTAEESREAAETARQEAEAVREATYTQCLYEVADLRAYLGYYGDDAAGLQADFANNTFTRLAGAKNLSAGADFDKFSMFGQRKRCNVADDGTIVAYYGDAAYAEDGSMGQVMVYQPKFYYMTVPVLYEKQETGLGYHLRKANYYVSDKPLPGFRLHPAFLDGDKNPVDYILFSAYEAALFDASEGRFAQDGTDTQTDLDLAADRLCSVAGQKPVSGLLRPMTKANFEALAQSRGALWHLDTVAAASANQLLMMIELGGMNTQEAISKGVVYVPENSACNCASLTGSTAFAGNGTGRAAETTNETGGTLTTYTGESTTAVSYRGMENPWGNIWKHIGGVTVWGDGTMGGGMPYIADGFDVLEESHSGAFRPAGFTLANTDGYISAMGYGGKEFDWLLMPSETQGTSSLPVGDYVYGTQNLNGYRTVQLGGSWGNGNLAGGFFWRANFAPGVRTRLVGGRLLLVPQAIIS